jgi:2-polyprenyl-3-methyl-5-hydroxy-6-metoxy-1,4-benzoquinol methylase
MINSCRQGRPDPMNCILCGANCWQTLPIPAEGRSITTSGILIAAPLGREQCMVCGVMRKLGARFLGDDQFYEEQYEDYYLRPGAERYEKARYDAMSQWMAAALNDFEPSSILDVGCGAGWAMVNAGARYDPARVEGVEPSVGNAEKARKLGFHVHSMRLGSGQTLSQTYDLVYAFNVLQHVVDPVGLLHDVANLLSPGGRVVLLLPDAAEPSNEMLWCDHNYSFRATDIVALAAKAGLKMVYWQTNQKNNALLNKQLSVLTKDDAVGSGFVPEVGCPPAELFKLRAEYLCKWQSLNGVLAERVDGYRRVFNFGASMWTWLLAGYCPTYWTGVEACLVDGERGRAVGKTVLPPLEVRLGGEDCIVLGINPANQSAFKRRTDLGSHIVSWSDQVQA